MGFCTGALVQVKALSTKYQRSQYLGFELYRRAYENRPLKWGKRLGRHDLWTEYRKVFGLSRVVEPEI